MSSKIGKYTIEDDEKFGSGGFGQIFLAKDGEEGEDKKHLYVIKIPLEDKMTGEDKKVFNNEIDILNILSKIPKNKYTSIIYDSQKFDEGEGLPFYVMDFFSKGLLYDYVVSGNMNERIAKYIFRKIILGFQFLHSNGICHLDIKIENIILDKDFWPVIIDFGFSKKYKNENGEITPLTIDKGTPHYVAPEIQRGEKFNGEKADIFSLGATLFVLVTGNYGFRDSKEDNYIYKLIRKKKYEEYWKLFGRELPEDFKNLYLSMVAHNPKERPTFEEILNSAWLKDVSNLTEEEENKIKDELKEKYDNFKSENEIFVEEKIDSEGLETRGGGDDENDIFKDRSLKPKKITKGRLNINKSIKINGNVDEIVFMNNLANKIIEKYKDNCYVEASKKNLKFEVEFDNEGEEEKEEENSESKMVVELFKYEEGGYLLEFRRTGGNVPEYYKRFSELKEIITKINEN